MTEKSDSSNTLHPDFKDRIQTLMRKPWREFIRIENETHCIAIARFYLGRLNATHGDFEAKTGIKLMDYKGCYMEAGAAISPTGPVLPGPVKRILAFKMSRSGRWLPKLLQLKGLYHETMKYAWVKTDLWEQVIGDDQYFEKVFLAGKDANTKRKRKRHAKKKKK